MGVTEVSQRWTFSPPAPAEELVVSAGVEKTKDWGQRLMPLGGTIDDTGSLGSIINRDGTMAKSRDRGQTFHKEVSKGAGIRASGIYPTRVSGEDGGFDAPSIRKCGGGMRRGRRLSSSR